MKTALIIYGGWAGHKPKETAAILADLLVQSEFSVELSDSLDVLSDREKLVGFDLLVPHWTMGQLTSDQEKNLLHAIEQGTGLGGIHGGMGDAFRGSSGFQFAVGGQFVSHPDNFKDYVVTVVKSDDPIVAGITHFSIHSEQYYMHVDPANEVLASTVFETSTAPWVNGTVMPVIWKRKYGKGRIFYSSIGHGVEELAIPEVREITRRGLVRASRT